MTSTIQTKSIYRQHVKDVQVDYSKLEKKQWKIIQNSMHQENPPIITEFTRRWHLCGENFPFPEAAPIVSVIIEQINKHPMLNNTLELSKKLIMQEAMNIDNTTENVSSNSDECPNYKEVQKHLEKNTIKTPEVWPHTTYLRISKPDRHTYVTPYNGMPFPYAPTLRWIARAMDFLDLVYFSEYAKKSQPLQGLYFRDRFRYYYDYMLAEAPKVFLFPTCSVLSATDLLNLGCSALQPLGIEWKPIFVDEYTQSPCNFFWHDLNHARRIHQHNQQLVEKWSEGVSFQNISNKYITWNIMYSAQHNVCTELMKSLMGKYGKLFKMLLFEVVHEDAIPWDWQWIWDDILLTDGNCFPYESTVPGMHRKTVKYYAKSAPMLATFYNKLRHEFFEQEFGKEYIVQTKYRTLEHIVNAVIELLTIIKDKGQLATVVPDRAMISNLILSQQYCEAKHTAHPLVLPPDISFARASLCRTEEKSIQSCSFVPDATERARIYTIAMEAITNPELCSKSGPPNSINGRVDPSVSKLVEIARNSSTAIGNSEFKFIGDVRPPLLPSDGSTSNGPNGVLLNPGTRINLFNTDDATTGALLQRYLKCRDENKRAIFDMVVKQMLETSSSQDYSNATALLRDIGQSEHFENTIGICSFCQTWTTDLPQFSVESPHFQNRIFIQNADHLDNFEQMMAYKRIVQEHDKILVQMGCAGKVPTFVNLDLLMDEIL